MAVAQSSHAGRRLRLPRPGPLRHRRASYFFIIFPSLGCLGNRITVVGCASILIVRVSSVPRCRMGCVCHGTTEAYPPMTTTSGNLTNSLTQSFRAGLRPPLRRAVICLTGAAWLAACANHAPQVVSQLPEAQQYAAHARGDYTPPGPPDDPWGPYINEAAKQFDVPDRWIREVMRVEVGRQAVSRQPARDLVGRGYGPDAGDAAHLRRAEGPLQPRRRPVRSTRQYHGGRGLPA